MLVRPCTLQRTTQPCHRLQPLLLHHPRFFHHSSRQDDPNHYETLEIATNASPAEIKKSFYTLSKKYHPDLHPSDPSASQRFVRISEAYATLSSPEKRSRYDRDNISTPSQSSSNPNAGRTGSYSSASTPWGGRPASGLSRRRTQFRGPPPSFYRSGGWGAHEEKRSEHARKASHSYEAQGQSASGPQGPGAGEGYAGYAYRTAGTGPGGFTQGYENDVPHFDRRGHFRTHEEIERMRHRARRKQAQQTLRRDGERDGPGGQSTGMGFVVISGVLLIALGLPAALFGVVGGRGRTKASAAEDRR